ncbi:ribonuclease HI [Thiomicrorhabdus sp. ZW0627]|uniref:ribonuclease H family protein n=1 Tax=Thiomicrorhabdus sp. ZW0627 TaxID=3039774 RepID=UPI0024366F92|nr:ribonuclease HI [Thiomicrorhabdus sp. ZW0627]MDG6772941.1 ribonuclease HI [Thiomicrorhabdus sp. ZW0627]
MTLLSKVETSKDQPTASCSNCLNIYTDGGYVEKKDVGGWGIVIIAPDNRQLRFSGSQRNTSSLEMELKAAVHALEEIQNFPLNDLIIQLFTDSKILIEGLDYKIRQYRQQNWVHKSGRPVESRSLWERFESLTLALKVNVKWVKGHSKVAGNLVADQLAREAIQGLHS